MGKWPPQNLSVKMILEEFRTDLYQSGAAGRWAALGAVPVFLQVHLEETVQGKIYHDLK